MNANFDALLSPGYIYAEKVWFY